MDVDCSSTLCQVSRLTKKQTQNIDPSTLFMVAVS